MAIFNSYVKLPEGTIISDDNKAVIGVLLSLAIKHGTGSHSPHL